MVNDPVPFLLPGGHHTPILGPDPYEPTASTILDCKYGSRMTMDVVQKCKLKFSIFWRCITSDTSSSSSWNLRINLKQCDIHRLLVSFWASVSFLGLGTALLIFGPTLLDLADHLGVGVGDLAAMFACRAIGAAIGSVCSGIALDKLFHSTYIVLTLILLSSLATTLIIPLSLNVYMLGIFMFLNGLATGALDSGTHAVLLRLWKDKSGPCMQVLHFAFAFGAFIAPLIAKQFISEEKDKSENCTESMNTGNISDSEGSGYCDTSDDSSDFQIAYWITSALFLPTIIAYLFYAIKYDIFGRCCNKKLHEAVQSDDNSSLNSEDVCPDDNMSPENNISTDNASSETFPEESTPAYTKNKQNRLFTIIIIIQLSIFMFIYVGLEVSFGSLIFTVVVKGELGFSKSQGTVIQALFWGTFAFARLFSVLLAVFRIKASLMMSGNLFGSVVAATIMVCSPHKAAGIWLGSSVLGMSYASIYPTAITWMSETIEVSGLATAILVTGGILGDITIPSAMAALIALVSPDALFYGTFVGILISAVFFISMFITVFIRKKGYTKLGDISGPQRLSLGDEIVRGEEDNIMLISHEVSEESTELAVQL